MLYKAKPRLTPVWEKEYLTLWEAVAYTGIGCNKLIELSHMRGSKIAVWRGGSVRLFKREKLEEFIDKAYSI